MMRIIKGCSIGLLILIKAFLLLVGYLYIASGQSAEYIQRTILWGQSDIYDYQRFPERAIQNAHPVSDFDKIGQMDITNIIGGGLPVTGTTISWPGATLARLFIFAPRSSW